MFCNKCGAQISENAKFCPACGNTIEVAESVTPVAPVTPVAQAAPVAQEIVMPVKKKKGKLIALFSGIGAAVVAIAVILIFVFTGGSKNYEDLIRTNVNDLNSRTLGYKTLENGYWDEARGKALAEIARISASSYGDVKDVDSRAEDRFKGYYETLDGVFGSDWKVSYEILEKEQYTAEEIQKRNEEWHLNSDLYTLERAKEQASYMVKDEECQEKIASIIYDFGKRYENDVTDAVSLHVKFTITGSNETFSFEEDDVVFVKAGGKWSCEDNYSILDRFLSFD